MSWKSVAAVSMMAAANGAPADYLKPVTSLCGAYLLLRKSYHRNWNQAAADRTRSGVPAFRFMFRLTSLTMTNLLC